MFNGLTSLIGGSKFYEKLQNARLMVFVTGDAMVWPNFLIIGAAKSGTTSLYHYLAQHPEVFMCAGKEINYFAYSPGEPARYLWGAEVPPERFSITTQNDYLALFDGVSTEQAVGEASPLYLGSATAPMAIRRQLPDLRLLAILRNPIDRAYSGYQMHLRYLRTDLPVSEAFDPSQHWIQQGMYHAMLARYYDLFTSSQIKVLLFDELKDDPLGLLRELYRFLAVDEQFIPPSLAPQNPGGTPRSRAFVAAAMMIRPAVAMLPAGVRRAGRAAKHKVLFRRAAPMPPEIRDRLRAVYREDVGRLSDLLRMDLERRWLALS